ncbi:MAG: hypothetical protein HY651_09315 [Acidobacteria bacterium]|nr:hypothetical protein [Acidobacteriota bacterium]
MTAHDDLQSLLATDTKGMSDSGLLEHIGLLIDASGEAQSISGTNRALQMLDELETRPLSAGTAALAHYFRANAWEGRRLSRRDLDRSALEQPEIQGQILALRRSINHEGFAQLEPIRQCQIFTNLANQLNTIGRYAEAIQIWDRALGLNEKFGMALGNRGIGLRHYAQALYDRRQATIMLVAAHDALAAAVAGGVLYDSPGYEAARDMFRKEQQAVAALGDIDAIRRHLRSHRYTLGKSEPERRYRKWCLSNRLFINPLNDLGPLPVAARDVLTLPSIIATTRSAMPPAVFGLFNQMKQEFVSARLLYYEGVHAKGVHFSDRGVLLFNTLDYPAFSLAIEKTRTAFRIAYSLFDKIAFFLNRHFQLGHDPNQVSFRNVWYKWKGSKRPWPLVPRFARCLNWPLRGLFWLSKDLYEPDFRSVTEPDAQALNEIRNHLEHKYLQLHIEGLGVDRYKIFADEPDRPIYSLTATDFAAKTLSLLQLVRCALIYLSLAVHCEERLPRKTLEKEKFVVPMMLDTWEDEWKQ